MTGQTNYSGGSYLDWITGKVAMPALPIVYVALFIGVGLDDGTSFVEPAGASYARVATAPADWTSPVGTGPTTDANAAPIVFPVPQENWGDILAFGFYDQPTGGNLLFWTFLGGFRWQPAYVAPGSPGTFNVAAHGFIVGDKLIFSTEIAGTAPAVSQGSLSGLLTVAHTPTADTFDVKTSGNTPINMSSSGGGTVLKATVQTINAGVTVSFAAGNLTLLAA